MKEQDEFIDDQILGSFIDGELDVANQEMIINAMENDLDLRERVYRLRRARDLMRLGYGEARPPSAGHNPAARLLRSLSTRAVATVAALVIGLSTGIFGYHYIATPGGQALIADAVKAQPEQIILHISQSSQPQFERTLAYTEQFLQDHTGNDSIEVVAHAGGLDLMREDISPLVNRITDLMNRFDNVRFIACANSISLLRVSGTEPRIIPGVATDSDAFDHIIDRLQTGRWQYIKVETLAGI